MLRTYDIVTVNASFEDEEIRGRRGYVIGEVQADQIGVFVYDIERVWCLHPNDVTATGEIDIEADQLAALVAIVEGREIRRSDRFSRWGWCRSGLHQGARGSRAEGTRSINGLGGSSRQEAAIAVRYKSISFIRIRFKSAMPRPISAARWI